MLPKEKAEDLFSIFCIYPLLKEQAIYLCLKAVDEIINTHQWGGGIDYDEMRYWEQVKHEINNL